MDLSLKQCISIQIGQSFSFITIDITLISILNVRSTRSPLAFCFSILRFGIAFKTVQLLRTLTLMTVTFSSLSIAAPTTSAPVIILSLYTGSGYPSDLGSSKKRSAIVPTSNVTLLYQPLAPKS
jgi:hypothetical protein